jgi:twitching motility protein PilU
MIGEIRDQETARHALNYADTGHLCLSTLHANSADQAVERLAGFFPDSARKQVVMEISMNLKAVISQRLLPAVGGGRAALATEMLLSSVHVTDLIREGRLNELKDAMIKGGASGMHCFDHSLYELHQAGRITLDEALRNADSRTDLSLRIRLSERRTVADAPDLSMVDLEAKGRSQAADAGRLYPNR